MPRQEGQITPYFDNLRNFLHDLAQPLSTVTGLIDLMLLEMDERDTACLTAEVAFYASLFATDPTAR